MEGQQQSKFFTPRGGVGGSSWMYLFPAGAMITKIDIASSLVVDSLKFTFHDGSVSPQFGGNTGVLTSINIRSPYQRLIGISGTVGNLGVLFLVTSLRFHTNRGDYGPYGRVEGDPFSMKIDEGVVVGFHGRAGDLVDAIGVCIKDHYHEPCKSKWDVAISTTYAERVGTMTKNVSNEGQQQSICFSPCGGVGGSSWMYLFPEGAMITKIDIASSLVVDSLKFTFHDGSVSPQFGGNTGVLTSINISSPSQRLIGISGTVGNLGVLFLVTSLRFHTNRGDYGPYGRVEGDPFSMKIDEGVVVGFHGRAGDLVDAIGVCIKDLYHGKSNEYDIFLSFRGADTRENFTRFLYEDLKKENIRTFMDDTTITPGEEIPLRIVEGIKNSLNAVVIFSENFANSSWCLDELLHIYKQKETFARYKIFPICYYITPEDIYKDGRKYHLELEKHKQQYGHKVAEWKEVLTKFENISATTLEGRMRVTSFIKETVDVIKKATKGQSSQVG